MLFRADGEDGGGMEDRFSIGGWGKWIWGIEEGYKQKSGLLKLFLRNWKLIMGE